MTYDEALETLGELEGRAVEVDTVLFNPAPGAVPGIHRGGGPGILRREEPWEVHEFWWTKPEAAYFVDGLLGDGLRILVVLTTNEELGRLHPAVVPGRCAARLEFAPLSAEEANAWLAHPGSDARVTGATSVADLYALKAGTERRTRPRVGFAAEASV